MATETDIPESVCLKKCEKDDNALSSEIMEEKVTELPVNKVKQLESGPNQPNETSSQVAETVNTQLETGKPTNESGTFFEALSVSLVTSNTPNSCEATATDDQDKRKTTETETLTEGKPNDDERLEAVSTETEAEEENIPSEVKYDKKVAIEKEAWEEPGLKTADSEVGIKLSESKASSKNEVLNTLEKDECDSVDVTSSQDATYEDVKETTVGQHTTTTADFKGQDLSEKPRDFLKEETENKIHDAKEASELCENGAEENSEQKPEDRVKKIEQEEEIEEIRPGVEIEENMEEHGSFHDITTDACISTQTRSLVETTEHEEKNETFDSPSIKEVCDETGSEKAEYHEKDLQVSVLEKDENHEKEQEYNILDKDKGDDDVTSMQDVAFEGGLEDKKHQSEGNECEVVKAKESIEEDTEEIRSSIETPEELEQQTLINVIPTDICVSTKTEPDEEMTENVEKNNEEAIESEDGQTNKSRSPIVKKIHEENVSEKAESEEGLKLPDSSDITPNENEITSKDEDQEKEQELNVSEQGQGSGNEITSSQNASSDDINERNDVISEENQKEEAEDRSIDAQEASAQYEDVTNGKREQKPEESINRTVQSVSNVEQEDYPEEIKPGVEPNEEKNVCISTQTEFQEGATKNEQNVIKCDGDQKENSDNPLVKEVCDDTDLKEILFEEEKNEKEISILSKDEDQEKEQELNMSEKYQGKDEVTNLQDTTAVSEEDLQEKNHHNEVSEPEVIEAKESMKEDTEETRSNDEPPEKTENSRLINDIPSDVCLSTSTETEEESTENVEKNDQKAIESDDGQTNKRGDPVVNEICEETILEKTEADEGLKSSNENKIASIDEDQEKDQKIILSEKRQGGGDDVTSSQNASDKDPNETTIGQDDTTVAYFEEGQGLSAIPKEISKEEVEHISIDAQEASEQYDDGAPNKGELKHEESVDNFEQPCSKIEQEEYSEEIKPSVGTNEENDVCISAQTESHEEATENEENDIEKDDGKENSNNSFDKEVCEEVELRKTEIKDIKLSDSSDMNEQAVELLSKDEDEDEEKEQELKDATTVSEEDSRGKDYGGESNEHELVETRESIKKDIDKEEDQQEEKYHNKGHEPVVATAKETVVEDAEEIKSSVEPKETTKTKLEEETTENEEKIVEEAIENDDDQTKKSEGTLPKEVCEPTSSEKAESEEGVKYSDSFNVTLDENDIVSKEINVEKEHELKMSEVLGGEDDFISSQNVFNEDIKERNIGQHATTEAYVEGQGVSATTEAIFKEEAEYKSIDGQEENEKCENGEKDKQEQKPEESVNDSVNSCSEIVEGNIKEDEADAGNNKEIEAMLDAENQADITEESSKMKDEVASTEKMSMDLEQPKEQNVEEIHASITETTSEKTEDEITTKNEGSPHDKIEDTNDNSTTEDKNFMNERTREIEIPTFEHEPDEKQNCGLNEVSEKKLTDINETTTLEPQDDIASSISLVTSTNGTSNLEKAEAESENLQIEDLESVSEVQIPEVVPMSEESKVKEECHISTTTLHVDEEKETMKEEISTDAKAEQTTDVKQETFEEAYEETSSEKAELEEGLKLANSSNIKINEKAMTTFNEDQEKDQEVNMSIEGQGQDNATSSHNASFKEDDLQEKSYKREGNEDVFVKTGESVDEDTEKINTSVETKEGESESSLFKEACEATSSEKVESEDGVKYSENSDIKLDENEIVSKEENQEKEPELAISEVQGGRDDVISSENISTEDIKETMNGQHATTTAYLEGQGVSAITEDIIQEEAEDKSIDAQEASDQCDNGAKDKSEQNHEESVHEPVKSCAEHVEGNITEDEADAGNDKEIQAKLDTENQVDRTEDKSEIDDEVVSTENVSRETIAVEPQEDIKRSSFFGKSTEDISDSEKAKAESENLPIEDRKSVSEVQIPEVVPKSEDSEIATYVDEEKRTATKEISTDEKSHITTEENVTQLEQIGENDTPYEKKDLEEYVTQEHQLNSTEDCSEIVNDVILTEEVSMEIQKEKEINDFKEQIVKEGSYSQNEKEMAHEVSYSDPIPVGNPEVKEVSVDVQIGQEDLQVAEDISCESKVKYDSVYEAPKEESIPSIEDDATLEPQVDLSNTESTAYPSESEKLPTQALESACDVQTTDAVAVSEDSKVKEECIVLAKIECMDENSVEDEQKNKINNISNAPDTEEEHIKQGPTNSDEEKMSDLNSEEKDLTKENLELHGELETTSESVIEEDPINETKPQPEKSDISSENIMCDQTLESKLEHTNGKDLEDVKRDIEEDVTLASKNQIEGAENQIEKTKNVILTDEVSVKTEKEIERNEVKETVSEENYSTTEGLDHTLTSNQKELENEQIELSKPVADEYTEVTKVIAESQIEAENIQVAKDLSCLSNASSTITGEVKDNIVDEASNDDVIPVLEDSKASELQVNLPGIEYIDTPTNGQDGMKLTEGIPCSTEDSIEEKSELISQLTDREISKEKEGEQISEVQTPEALVKMEKQEEHPKATNDTCDTLTDGVSSEKLFDELKEIDAKEDIEAIAEGEKTVKESYQDAVAEVTVHERSAQTEEELVSLVPPEELIPPTDEEKTYELVLKTDKTAIEHDSLGNKDQNSELVEEEFTETFSENQSIKERYIEGEGLSSFGIENKEVSGNEIAEDVIVNEVLLEEETAQESKSIKDNINEETIHNRLTSATDEVCQIETLSSSPNELPETEYAVEDTEDPKLMSENLNLKDGAFTATKELNEYTDTDASAKMVTEEKMIETDENKEKETLDEPQTDYLPKTTSDSISCFTEQDIEVRSEESRGHGDMIILEEKSNEVCEVTSEVAEIVPEGQEASKIVTDNLPETSSKMPLAKHELKIPTTSEKIEDEIKDKEVECLQVENTTGIQVSTLNSEIEGDEQNGPGDMLNKKHEAQQPQEHISKIEVFDPPSDVEPPYLDTKEATSEFSNQENQREQKEEAFENIEDAILIEDVKSTRRVPEVRNVDLEVPSIIDATADKAGYNEDPKNKTDEAYEAVKGVLKEEKPLESTYDSEMKQEPLEVDAPVILGTPSTEDLKISQIYVKDDVTEISQTQPEIQKYEVLTYPMDKQSPNVQLENESKLLTEKIDASQEQGEATAKSLVAEVEDTKATQTSTTKPQCNSEVLKEEKYSTMRDEKEKSESAEAAKSLSADMLHHEPTKENSEVAENLNGDKQPDHTKDQQVGKEESGECEVKTDDENEEEVIVEASKDMEEVKVHKKSHNILSGVGSKVKHSLAKVKKAITGKSSHQKPPSP